MIVLLVRYEYAMLDGRFLFPLQILHMYEENTHTHIHFCNVTFVEHVYVNGTLNYRQTHALSLLVSEQQEFFWGQFPMIGY